MCSRIVFLSKFGVCRLHECVRDERIVFLSKFGVSRLYECFRDELQIYLNFKGKQTTIKSYFNIVQYIFFLNSMNY